MHWNRGYRLVSYVRSSLWVVPFIAIVLEQIAIRVLARIDRAVGYFQLTREESRRCAN
jgi:cytochrome c-type biogenesis protein CcmH/NrfF